MIEFDVRRASNGFSNRRSHREIRHKMPVHDVDMDHFGAGLFNRTNFFAQPHEIRGENGGNDLNHSSLTIAEGVTRAPGTVAFRIISMVSRLGQVPARNHRYRTNSEPSVGASAKL